jgi:CRP-like cAMP-binding protein
VSVQAGCTLIDAGAPAGFVYIPLNGSLQVIPLGDYPAISIQPWMPLGITAVIRGSVRNATVIAEEDLDLLMIPQEIYLQYWHHTYNPEEFIEWMAAERARQNAEAGDQVHDTSLKITLKDEPGQA